MHALGAVGHAPVLHLRPRLAAPVGAVQRHATRTRRPSPPQGREAGCIACARHARTCRSSCSQDDTPAARTPPHKRHLHGACSAAAAALLLTTAAASPAAAWQLHAEPANALSLPTWVIHVSSVVEWVTAMGLMWQYAEATGNSKWKGMTWGMLPCLGSAMAACTWHFFYNSPDLEFLVALQAFLTVVGNCTCWIAAYRIYVDAQQEGS